MAKNKVNIALVEKMLAASATGRATQLSESNLFSEIETVVTPVPILNVVWSGELDGGLEAGIHQIVAPSKHFKSLLGLIAVKSYLDKYDDAICLFFDSEFGAGPAYFHALEIDPERVVHMPFLDIEEFKIDITKQLNQINRGDHVIIFVDSIGLSASRKEAEDAEEGRTVTDMSRAKQINSAFRIINPHTVIKNVPVLVINHGYKEIGTMFPKTIVGGGEKAYLASQSIIMISRAQDKDSNKELQGYFFTITIEKSRKVVEKSQFELHVTFDGGVDLASGLLPLALEAGLIVKAGKGVYNIVNEETGEPYPDKWKESELTYEIFEPMLKTKRFKDYVSKTYKVSTNKLINKPNVN